MDLPSMAAVKRKALAALGCATTSGVKDAAHPLRCARWGILSADLGTDGWPAALRAAGFEPDVPTLWVVEGLLMYLEPGQAEALLRTMHGGCGGCSRGGAVPRGGLLLLRGT